MQLLLITLTLIAQQAPPRPPIFVRNDPRVELLEIIFRLAGSREFKDDVARSPYVDDVDAWFAPFEDHPAVRLAKELRDKHGISYSAVPDLAVHVDAVPSLRERLSFEPLPGRLDNRWTAPLAHAFLEASRSFAHDTKCERFFAKYEALYAETAKRLDAKIADAGIQDWVSRFFGPRAKATTFTVIPSVLNGHHNYGCGVLFSDGRLELSPVVGIWAWDDKSIPLFGEDHIFTVAHEFTHSFANSVIDRHVNQFEPAGRKLFASVEAVMRSQAYGNWKIMMYESLVRACVVRYLAIHDGETAAEHHAQEDAKRGFRWVGDLAHLLSVEYEPDRAHFPDLDAFAPRLVEFFDGLAIDGAVQDMRAPRVVTVDPPTGAVDVDPSTTVIRVTFDRPMKTEFHSVISGGPSSPTTVGEPSWDATQKIFMLRVQLEPGRSYRLGLNEPGQMGFQSSEGIPLEPMILRFTTRAK